ncbi:hypothetical protein BJF83_10745 [Nocardiopsis sp. CNR-923]|uniref:DUF3040 domain-containing protein n=1 Tax=Nocardiopsis sp. CNR-923 TaxID=1904965 RepID=UPI00095ED312|nr:DUF3040 domain-containing protein [Nocardiopsis sp. CNR-923]OLT29615.1 hypothetical protein BJF83_10745 [Nocardiopsis sp. CNR-923]
MSLREHERRILAEIERQLSEEAPDLAGRLSAFGSDDPDAPLDPSLTGWRPWVACAVIAAVTAGLLVLLFVLTPSAPSPSPSETAETPETSEPADTPVAPAPVGMDPAGTMP